MKEASAQTSAEVSEEALGGLAINCQFDVTAGGSQLRFLLIDTIIAKL